MRLEDLEVGAPAPDEVQVRHTAIGLNFIDVYDRTGLYPRAHAGRTSGARRGCRGRARTQGARPARRRTGRLCDRRRRARTATCAMCPQRALVKIPAGVSDEQAAVLMLKGMTACYLLTPHVSREARRRHRGARGRGRRRAAAVAMGQGAGRAGHRRGRQTRPRPHSRERTAANMCWCADASHRRCGQEDSRRAPARTSSTTRWARTPSSNRSTACASADSGELRQRFRAGAAVLHRRAGQARLVVPHASDAVRLHRRARATSTRWRARLSRRREEEVAEIQINQRYSLADAAQAHRDLEARKTTGASVILPA